MVLEPTDTTLDSMATAATLPTHTPTATDTQPLTATDLTGSTSVMLMPSQRLMLTTAASTVLVPTDTTLDSMATVDTLPTHTPMAMDTQPLTATDLTGSTSVMLMLSQRLMLTTAASTVLDPTDTTLDSMATADTLPTHTPTVTDTQPPTATDLTGSTSVMLMPSQRLM